MSNERSRDFGGAQPQSQGSAGRRDPGEESLLELARLIGGQGDPFAPDTPNADVSRAVASQGDGYRRRDSDFGNSAAEPPGIAPRAGDGFDFPSRHGPPDEPGYGAGRGGPNSGRGRAYEPEHDDYDGYDDEYGEPDDYDDDGSGGGRRRPTRLIMILLGLAVLGSAALYGYRNMIAGARSGPTPIIRADNSPTKITPMSDVKQGSGLSGDRQGEQLVRRDEEPVNVNAGGADAGDVVPPPGPALPGDPRRVHTVPIRADQGTASSPAARATRQSAPRQAAAATVQPAPPPAPPPQTRQVAAVTPPAEASAAAAPESGGYVVQLVAVRSEADAQSEFRRLQAKYSSVLTGHQPLIRRKDKGDQVFYAAGVGPFGDKGEADQFCEQLKAAGGSCYVYKN